MSQHVTSVMPEMKRCLVVVDMQVDFITGSLALKRAPAGQDPETLVPLINTLIQHDMFDVVVYSLDYHPPNHISFVENAAIYVPERHHVEAGEEIIAKTIAYGMVQQQVWPRHCVQDTEGVRLWPTLYRRPTALYVHKGTEPLIESYAVFGNPRFNYDTGLHSLLQTCGVTHLYFVGVAEDVCVGHSALSALTLGYDVSVIQDAVCGVNRQDCDAMKASIVRRGGHYVCVNDVLV